MAATAKITKAENKKQYDDKLRQFPDFNAVLGAADAGMIGGAVSTITAATTDFQTDADERSREAKASANTLRILAQFFAIKHDDTLNEHGDAADADAEIAFLDMDNMRDDLVQKLWIYHDIITVRLFPGDTHEDAHGRRSGGNNINIILEHYFESRRARLSKHTKDDPIYEPPTKTDFITSTKLSSKKGHQAKHGIMPGETSVANGGAAASRLPPAPAESGKPEGDANEESDAEINRRREGGKRAANWLAGQQGQQHEHPAPKSSTKTAGSDAAGGHASPAAAAAQQIINPTPTVAYNQPDFSKLIHALELDAVRRNVVGVRPRQPFE